MTLLHNDVIIKIFSGIVAIKIFKLNLFAFKLLFLHNQVAVEDKNNYIFNVFYIVIGSYRKIIYKDILTLSTNPIFFIFSNLPVLGHYCFNGSARVLNPGL